MRPQFRFPTKIGTIRRPIIVGAFLAICAGYIVIWSVVNRSRSRSAWKTHYASLSTDSADKMHPSPRLSEHVNGTKKVEEETDKRGIGMNLGVLFGQKETGGQVVRRGPGDGMSWLDPSLKGEASTVLKASGKEEMSIQIKGNAMEGSSDALQKVAHASVIDKLPPRPVIKHALKGSTGPRWRNNDYVMEHGILPYQRCSAGQFSPGPPPGFGIFTQDNVRYTLVLMGTTVWGESDDTGKPIAVHAVQFLFYFQFKDKPCDSIHYARHCYLPEIFPRITCRMAGSSSKRTKAFRDEDRMLNVSIEEKPNVPIDPVYCPFPEGVDGLDDKFVMELFVGDTADDSEASPIMSVDICYEHVQKAAEVTVCTQPQFGYTNKSGYWQGNPPFSNYSLMDSFILYHTELMGTSVVVYDTQSSLEEAMEPYRERDDVKYRPNWGLYELQDPGVVYNPYGYQAQAEIACFWEQRFRARFVFFLHSADCYVLPSNVGESLVHILQSRINASEISEIRIPTVEAHSPEKPIEGNILLRFPLLGRGGLIKQKRFTPLGNPRDFDAANVHIFTANRTTFKGRLGTHDCVFKLHLRTIHIFAASRALTDRHAGRKDAAWDRLGLAVEVVLAKYAEQRLASLARFRQAKKNGV